MRRHLPGEGIRDYVDRTIVGTTPDRRLGEPDPGSGFFEPSYVVSRCLPALLLTVLDEPPT